MEKTQKCVCCDNAVEEKVALCIHHYEQFDSWRRRNEVSSKAKLNTISKFRWSIQPVEVIKIGECEYIRAKKPPKLKFYNPLSKTNLFNEFCDGIKKDDKIKVDIVKFVEDNGFLGIPHSQEKGSILKAPSINIREEPLHSIKQFHIKFKRLRDIIRTLIEDKASDIAELKPNDEYTNYLVIHKQYGGKKSVIEKEKSLNDAVVEYVADGLSALIQENALTPAVTVYESKEKVDKKIKRRTRARLTLQPNTLAGVLLIQLCNYWSEGKPLKQCERLGCNTLTNTERKYCSDTCGSTVRSAKRRAIADFEAGKKSARFKKALVYFTKKEKKDLFGIE